MASSALRLPTTSQALTRTTYTLSSKSAAMSVERARPASPKHDKHSKAHKRTSYESSPNKAAHSLANVSAPMRPNAISAAHLGRRSDGSMRGTPPPMRKCNSEVSSAGSSSKDATAAACGSPKSFMCPSASAAVLRTPTRWSCNRRAMLSAILADAASPISPKSKAAVWRVWLSASVKHWSTTCIANGTAAPDKPDSPDTAAYRTRGSPSLAAIAPACASPCIPNMPIAWHAAAATTGDWSFVNSANFCARPSAPTCARATTAAALTSSAWSVMHASNLPACCDACDPNWPSVVAAAQRMLRVGTPKSGSTLSAYQTPSWPKHARASNAAQTTSGSGCESSAATLGAEPSSAACASPCEAMVPR
mmetsp:Transcript_74029/g.226435  ORF Transcript_74029/g.226435 Transcript_74029/m.226435 type:complete len:364 (-) Transcript_74029:84-1175(-)